MSLSQHSINERTRCPHKSMSHWHLSTRKQHAGMTARLPHACYWNDCQLQNKLSRVRMTLCCKFRHPTASARCKNIMQSLASKKMCSRTPQLTSLRCLYKAVLLD